MKKLRLLITKHCHRKCSGCVNKDHDLDNLPIEYDFSEYDEICFTGGEPLIPGLHEETIQTLSAWIKFINSNCKIYIYSAHPWGMMYALRRFKHIDGYTLTLHDNNKTDLAQFKNLNYAISYPERRRVKNLSLRLNVFKGVNIPEDIDLSNWIIKDNIEWIKDCPIREDEVFKRIKNI